MARLAADRIDQRPLIPIHDLARMLGERLRNRGLSPKRLHENDGFLVGLRIQELEYNEVWILRIQAGESDHGLDRSHLFAQIFLERLLVAERTALRRTVILIEKITRALEVFEHA